MGVAQQQALKRKLSGLESARAASYQVPRLAEVVPHPARLRADPRFKDPPAGRVANPPVPSRPVPAEPAGKVVFGRPPARSWRDGSIDLRTLATSFAITGPLVGSAFAMMIWTGMIDTPWSGPLWSPPEKRTVAMVRSASAAGNPIPEVVRQIPPPDVPVLEAAPPQEQTTPEDIALATPEDGVGLFGDVREVNRGDGEKGVSFGAIYDAPGSGAAESGVKPSETIPELPTRAPAGEGQATAEPAKPEAGAESDDGNWLELPIDVNLRSGPSLSAGVIGVLEKGSRLKELDRKRGWVKVIDPETSKTGWLYPKSAPRGRRAAKQQAAQEDQADGPNGPLATLGNWLSRP